MKIISCNLLNVLCISLLRRFFRSSIPLAKTSVMDILDAEQVRCQYLAMAAKTYAQQTTTVYIKFGGGHSIVDVTIKIPNHGMLLIKLGMAKTANLLSPFSLVKMWWNQFFLVYL